VGTVHAVDTLVSLVSVPGDKPFLKDMIFSPVRGFQMVLKLSENNTISRTNRSRSQLRGHFVLFKHDANQVASKNVLAMNTWRDAFHIQFFCRENKKDHLMELTRRTSLVSGRAYVIVQYLKVFELVGREGLDGIAKVDFKELKSQLDQFKDNVIRTASVIEHKNSLAYLQDNMGADVANVRSTVISPLTNSDRGNDDADSAEIDVDPVTETTLFHEEHHIKEDGDSPQDRIMKDFVDTDFGFWSMCQTVSHSVHQEGKYQDRPYNAICSPR
jgi:hypothetical protein